MCVQVDRKLGASLQSRNKLVCLLGTKQTGHILDAQGIRAELFNLARNLLPVLERISVAERIYQSDLRVCAGFLRGLYRSLHVTKIIQAVENSDSVDTVLNRLLDKAVYNIIRVMGISEDILSAQQHLGRCLLEMTL